MKTKTIWKSVASVVLLMAMIVLVTVSCKKKDDETPVTPPPTEPTVGKLFTNLNGYNFLTKEEQNNQGMYFSGDYLFTYARGIHQYCTGGTATEIPYFDIFTFAHELSSEKTLQDSLEVNFRKIDQSLAKIQTQLKTLILDVEALNIKLELGILDIEAMMQGYISADLTDDILSAWDSTTSNGMRWYSVNATLCQQGNMNAVPFYTLKEKIAPDFINRYYGNPTVNLQLDIQKIGQMIIGSTQPATPSFANSTLKTFIDKELLMSKTLYSDSTHAMYSYKLLEDFFLTSVNYQYQGLMAYGNCVIGQDTSGTAGGKQELSEWYKGTFVPYLVAELKVFNQAVAYLATNSYDYRNEAKFSKDMNNFQYGVTDDYITGPVYSRANLINSLIMNAMGQVNQPIYLNANFPYVYQPNSIDIAVNGGSIFGVVPTNIVNSQFYFTNWNSPTSIIPDYKMNCFNYQFDYTGSKPGNVYFNPLVLVGLMSNPCQGTIPRVFIDPTNIRNQSNTADATHTLPFGSGTVNWPWGYFNLSYESATLPWQRIKEITVYPFNFSTGHNVGLPSYYHMGDHDHWYNMTNSNQFSIELSEIRYNGPTLADAGGCILFQDIAYVNLTGVIPGETNLFSRLISDPPSPNCNIMEFTVIGSVTDNISTAYCNKTQSNTYPTTYDYVVSIPSSNAIAFGYELQLQGPKDGNGHEFGTIFQAQPIFMGLAPIFP